MLCMNIKPSWFLYISVFLMLPTDIYYSWTMSHGAGICGFQWIVLIFKFSSFIHLDDHDPLHQHDAADHQPVESTNRVTSGKTNDVSRDKNTRKRQNWFPQCLYKAHLNSVFIFRKIFIYGKKAEIKYFYTDINLFYGSKLRNWGNVIEAKNKPSKWQKRFQRLLVCTNDISHLKNIRCCLGRSRFKVLKLSLHRCFWLNVDDTFEVYTVVHEMAQKVIEGGVVTYTKTEMAQNSNHVCLEFNFS